MTDMSALATIDGDHVVDPMFVDVTLSAQESFPLLYDTSKEDNKVDSECSPAKESAVSTSKPQIKSFRCLEKVNDMQCTYSTTDKDRLIRHVRKVHRGENPFQCTMCDYSTYNKCIFEEHVRIHQGIKPFKCRYCPYSSASKKNAKKHELIHRPDNPLRCTQCEFIARHERSLSYHMISHLTCSKCNLKMENEEELKAHQCSATQKKLKCEICKQFFRSKKNFNFHLRNVKKCEDCDVILCSKFRLVRHMSTVHGKSVPSRCSYTCGLCQWSGNNPARILLHLIHHPVNELPDVPGIAILKKYRILQ